MTTQISYPSVQKPSKYLPFFQHLLHLLIVLISWSLLVFVSFKLLAAGSYHSVGHDLHAVSLGNDQFIHGSHFACNDTRRGANCGMLLNGEQLIVNVEQFHLVPNSIGSCQATYAGSPVACEKSYVTDSTWAHGVQIVDSAVIDAHAVQRLQLTTWRNFMLGSHYGHSFLIMTVTSLALHMMVVVVVPFALGRYTKLLQDWSLSTKYIAIGVAFLLWIPTWLYFSLTLLHFGFVD